MLLLCVALPWMWAREITESQWRDYHWRFVCAWDDGLGPYSPFWAHGFWSIVEVLLGLASFFIGAGFYVYPSAAFIAGLLRLWHWLVIPIHDPKPCKLTTYVPEDEEGLDTGCGYPKHHTRTDTVVACVCVCACPCYDQDNGTSAISIAGLSWPLAPATSCSSFSTSAGALSTCLSLVITFVARFWAVSKQVQLCEQHVVHLARKMLKASHVGETAHLFVDPFCIREGWSQSPAHLDCW